MNISVVERLRPFSHLPGTSTVLCGWGVVVEIFPSVLRFHSNDEGKSILLTELQLDTKGAVDSFTVFNDLEVGAIIVIGRTPNGWLRYRLTSSCDCRGVRLYMEKAPSAGISLYEKGEKHLLVQNEWVDLLEQKGKESFHPYSQGVFSRLSFGCHKTQDWELVSRRNVLSEILPFIHRLGSSISYLGFPSSQARAGTLSLLEDCRECFQEKRPERAEAVWLHFVRGCFRDLLVPQLEDSHHQGIIPFGHPSVSLPVSPLVLLTEASALISRFIIEQEENQIAILPFLPPSLHCGRFIDVLLSKWGKIHIEWTKKMIRRVILVAEETGELEINFRHVRNFRLYQSTRDKGKKEQNPCVLSVKKGSCYFFDHFEA